MASTPLDQFGESLIQGVRDQSISDWDKILDGKMKGRTAELIRDEISRVNPDLLPLLRDIIPRIVDTTLHHFLAEVEKDQTVKVLVSVNDTDSIDIREESDGLTGELYGNRGWIARFSKKRHFEG